MQVTQPPGSYIALERSWNNGDQIEINFPMELVLNPSDNPDIVFITYGPLVLAAKMGTEGMQDPAPYSNPSLHNDYYTYDYHVPMSLTNILPVKGQSVTEWLKPITGQSLVFKTDSKMTGLDYTFIPLYDLHRERYVVYWKLK